MDITANQCVVNAQFLNDRLVDEQLIVLFTAMVNPVTGKNDSALNGFIPGARLFDFENEICDLHSGLPHTMPSQELFERKVSELGISSDSVIVVYDNNGIYCSARVWWMFKAMGHEKIFVLDGGFPAWIKRGFPVAESLVTALAPSRYKAHVDPALISSASQVLEAVNDPHFAVLDARSHERFYGQVLEPRPGLRSGHIPHSKNLPFEKVLNTDKTLKTERNLSQQFYDLAVSGDEKLILTCGSGVTACILALAAYQCGFRNISVYDGSWSEWGADAALPVSNQD